MSAHQAALIAHLRQGVGEKCLVCDEALHGQWTDYNGQIRCWSCGTPYQILGCHLREEWMAEVGLTKSEVAERYCDDFVLVPLLRDYWHETKRQIPFGCFISDRNRPSKEQYDAFNDCLKANADRYETEFADEFHWDRIKAGN